MKALHFGAGNIGRGFIGKTLSQSGFHVVFADSNQILVDAINDNQEYSVKTVSHSEYNIVTIKNISAINSDNNKIYDVIASVNLITTAVGATVLDKLASIITQGIILRKKQNSTQPLNIIACENKIRASSFLKKAVLKKLPIQYYDYLNKYVGFIDCTIDTIIPFIEKKRKDYLFVIAEDFKEWIVDVKQFKGVPPKIIDMKFSDNLNSFIERKLFTLNTGHAVAAYLGLIKKYRTIQETMSDEKICFIVRSAMEESGATLIKRHNFNKNDHIAYIEKIFCRFKNPFLSDNLQRIARNPLQKLGSEERLIKPFFESIKYKLSYSCLSKGIAAVFYYYNPNDLESIQISSLIKKKGIQNTLIEVCNLSINSEELCSILSEYNSILKTIQ